MRHTGTVALRIPAIRVIALVVVVLLGAAALALTSPAPANAAARLSVSSSLGGDVASSAGSTTFTVSGSGFQAIDGGFGGVYVGFGWVNGSNWGPSKGGATGSTYDYVPDEQSRDNQGYQKFVAFPGSSTSGEAQATMGSDGSFRTTLTVPGPTFTGAGGKRIDCLKMTCGFFTWGAHGVRNGSNETFTPVTFQAEAAPAEGGATESGAGGPAATSPAQSGRAGGAGRAAARSQGGNATQTQPGRAQAAQQSGGAQAVGEGSAPDASAAGESAGDQPDDALDRPTVATAAVIEVDRRAARPGGAMGFAAAGFWPGEQVYVVLGDGDAAVGPVVAGVDGEVAGVMVLPEDMEVGTHEIRAAGAGSGLEATERFPVQADIANTASESGLRGSVKWIFLALSALVLLAIAAVMVKRRQEAAAEDHDVDPDDDASDVSDASDGGDGIDGIDGIDHHDDGDALPYAASTATPFPHPAMAGGTDQPTTAFEKKDLR